VLATDLLPVIQMRIKAVRSPGSLFFLVTESRRRVFAVVISKEIFMRLDKYLKVSRLIKRRTVANEACDAGRVLINDKVAKASAEVKVGDVIEIGFGTKSVKVEVLDIQDTTKKDEAKDLFKYL